MLTLKNINQPNHDRNKQKYISTNENLKNYLTSTLLVTWRTNLSKQLKA